MIKLKVEQFDNKTEDEIEIQINEEHAITITEVNQIIDCNVEGEIVIRISKNSDQLIDKYKINAETQNTNITVSNNELQLMISFERPELLHEPDKRPATEEVEEVDSSEPALNEGNSQENSDKSQYNLSTINDVPREDTDDAEVEHLNTQTVQAIDEEPGNDIQIQQSVKGNSLYFYEKFQQITNLTEQPSLDQLLSALLNFESCLLRLEVEQKDQSSSIQLHRNFQGTGTGTQ